MYKYIYLNINIYIYTIFIYGYNPFVPTGLNVQNENRLDDKLTREEPDPRPDPGLEGPKCYRSFGSGSRTLRRTHTKENQAVRSTKHRAQLSCKENKGVRIRM
jgi:hypothetical protein